MTDIFTSMYITFYKTLRNDHVLISTYKESLPNILMLKRIKLRGVDSGSTCTIIMALYGYSVQSLYKLTKYCHRLIFQDNG